MSRWMTSRNPPVRDLTPEDVARGLAEGRMLLVDVREPNEIAIERYPDAVVVPLSNFDPRPDSRSAGPAGRVRLPLGTALGDRLAGRAGAGLALRRASRRRDPRLEGGRAADRDLTGPGSIAAAPGRHCHAPQACNLGRGPARGLGAARRMRRGAAAAPSMSTTGPTTSSPSVLEDFTKETGIKVTLRHVRFQRHAGDQAARRQVRLRRGGADRLFPGAPDQGRRVPEARQDRKLPNLGNVWPEIAQRLAIYDPGNQYAVNYMWGTTGIGYNVKKAREILGGATRDSDRQLGHRVQAGAASRSFKDCGVHMLDSPDDIMPAALHYLGLNPNTKEQADLEKAADLLTKIRPSCASSIRRNISTRSRSGEICLVVGCSGDIKQAQKRAAEAKNGVEIGYAIPKDGAQMWFDNLAIPKDARNVAEAHAFINYLLRPEVAAKNTQFHLLCQRQSGEPAVHRQGGARGPHHLSGRRDDEDALHHHGARPEDAAADEPAVDPDQDRAGDLTASGGAARAIARGARAPSLRRRW